MAFGALLSLKFVVKPASHSETVVSAAINKLKLNHDTYHKAVWASTPGSIVGKLQHSPKASGPGQTMV